MVPLQFVIFVLQLVKFVESRDSFWHLERSVAEACVNRVPSKLPTESLTSGGNPMVPSYLPKGQVENLSTIAENLSSSPLLEARYSAKRSRDRAISLNMSLPLPNSGSYPERVQRITSPPGFVQKKPRLPSLSRFITLSSKASEALFCRRSRLASPRS